MIRISNEDGFHAGARNIGRYFLFLVPLVLGLGASAWLGVWIQAHYFLIDRAQEQRSGSFVAAPDPERAPYLITTYTGGSKIKIDAVDIHNGVMTVRFHNFSAIEANNLQLHWQWIAPDGTKLADHWDWCYKLKGPSGIGGAEKGIVEESDLNPDPRASGVGVWVIGD